MDEINNKSTTLTNKNQSYLNESYFNEKNKSNKGSSMLNTIQENEKEKNEYEKLCEDLKDSQILIKYILEGKDNFKFDKIRIGNNYYEDIYKIGKNEIGKTEIDNFRDFLQEIKTKIDTYYNKKNEFTLELIIKGDKDKNNCVLDCTYNLEILEKDITIYKEFNILLNKTSEAFEMLLNHLNNFSNSEN